MAVPFVEEQFAATLSQVHVDGNRRDRNYTQLMSPMNFARNYVDELLLPLGVTRVVYMDTDTIVRMQYLEQQP